MTTQWTRWLVVASAMAALSLGFVSQTKADDYLKDRGYAPLPVETRTSTVQQQGSADRPITFTASPNPYRYRYSRYRYRPVFVQPVYYGYYPYGGYSPYNVPSVSFSPLPAPFSYDTFHPFLGY